MKPDNEVEQARPPVTRPVTVIPKEPVCFPECAAFILAGGQSSRMGRDKALLEFAGTPLIVHTAHLLEFIVGGATVIGPPERYAPLGLRVIPDELCDAARTAGSQGPLAGIATALRSTTKKWNLILACDLPFLAAEWLIWLLTRARKSSAQIVIPETSHGLEPLAAAYRRDSGALISASASRGIGKVTEAFADLVVERLTASEWREFDPDGNVLRNMNTAGDYEFAKLRWASQSGSQPGEKSRIRRVRRGHSRNGGSIR